MSPPIREGSGDSIGSIRLGDGTEISEVRTGAGDVLFSANAIPDSVDHQYPFSTFTTSTWADDVGSADMSVNGLTASTFANGEDAVFGDGVDDSGFANGPQNLPQNESFGVAFTIQFSGVTGFHEFAQADENTNPLFGLRSDGNGVDGNISLGLEDDNDNVLRVATDSAFDDGSVHAVVINKTSNSASGIDIYVDDMGTAQSDTTIVGGSFDHSSYNNSPDMGFFGRNANGSFTHRELFAGVWEFNTAPYNQSERKDFVSRRSEV